MKSILPKIPATLGSVFNGKTYDWNVIGLYIDLKIHNIK